ncbi:MAG TPA: hypothetical protein DEF39_04160 [Hungateiclostridium thermocellum]|nr:hypothetical protein [Acetivibrio thermocellus]
MVVYLQKSLFKVTEFTYYKHTAVIGLNPFGGFFCVQTSKFVAIDGLNRKCMEDVVIKVIVVQ